MLSTLGNSVKRIAEDLPLHSSKKMRLINHAYDYVPQSRGTKRRNEEEVEEPAKKSKVETYVKRVKRKGDCMIMNPTKRIKTTHRSWRRNIQGCRPSHYAEYDDDNDGGNNSVWIAIVA